jgi:hypothetical protein
MYNVYRVYMFIHVMTFNKFVAERFADVQLNISVILVAT